MTDMEKRLLTIIGNFIAFVLVVLMCTWLIQMDSRCWSVLPFSLLFVFWEDVKPIFIRAARRFRELLK